MNEDLIRNRIEEGRHFISSFQDEIEGFVSDQDQKKPQPPLVKAPMGREAVSLPVNYEDLPITNDFLKVINSRSSHRVFTSEGISLLELSYLLWCCQGVKELRGKSYATLRTVPSGGARHAFECYLAIQNVRGLKPGLWHYLPMTHQIEFLSCPENLKQLIGDSLCEQVWAEKADVVFYLSAVFRRAEWRYGPYAHVPMLIDSGHVFENLYLACTSVGLGGCAIAAVDGKLADQAFCCDGKEETIFYAMPIGTISENDQAEEKNFYAFVKEQGL
ncbi:MAG: SagB/ThcOx family dehydrogenase [Bulleidia sp.]